MTELCENEQPVLQRTERKMFLSKTPLAQTARLYGDGCLRQHGDHRDRVERTGKEFAMGKWLHV